MKRLRFLLLLLAALMITSGCSKDSAPTLTVSAESAAEGIQTVNVDTTYDGKNDCTGRQILLLSVYDADGSPLSLDGTATTASFVDLYADIHAPLPLETKTIQGHQAVYATPCRTLTQGESHNTSYTVISNDLPSSSAVIRLDVFLLDESDCVLASQTICLSGSAESAMFQADATLPDLTDTTSFRWEVVEETAILTGLGNVTETDLLLPTQVYLTETESGWTENGLSGQKYPVEIAGYAMIGCEELTCVTFQDGAVISAAHPVEKTGADLAFTDCTGLTEVHNIPGGLTNLTECFMGCTSLIKTPILPDGAENLSYCFADCTALTEAVLPEGVVDLTRTFFHCTSLETSPEIPAGVECMSYTFAACTALTASPELPEGLLDLSYCFNGCTAMTSATPIPDSVVNVDYCYFYCKNLTGTVSFPVCASTSNGPLDAALRNCPKVEKVLLRTCPYVFSRTELDVLKCADIIEYTGEHTTEGLCLQCGRLTTKTSIRGIDIVFDSFHEDSYKAVIDYLSYSVPNRLIEKCEYAVFTNNLEPYYGDGYDKIAGFCPASCDRIYVLDGNAVEVTTHELAHSFDYYRRYSYSSEWKSVLNIYGDEFGIRYYSGYENLNQLNKLCESFACAVTQYFHDPKTFLCDYPELYAYVDNFFHYYDE